MQPKILMTIAQETDLKPEIIFPPSDIYSDEPPLETELHLRQIIALWQSIEWLWRERNDFYVAGNLTIYYSPQQLKSQDFRGPDLFVVLGTERKTRKSWVVWAENGQYPHVIVEILSPTTATTDKNLKKEIYQNIFRTPDYFWFDPNSLELTGFHLVEGKYQPLSGNEQGHLWSEQLGLYLGVNQGVLRFFTLEGQLVLIPQETAQLEAQKATQAEQRAQQAQETAIEEAQKATQAEQRSIEEAQKATQAEQRAQQAQETAIEEALKATQAEQRAQQAQETAIEEALKATQAEQRAQQAQETAIEEAQKATQAEQRAQLEAIKATQAQFKAERLAAKLRELNIDPDTL